MDVQYIWPGAADLPRDECPKAQRVHYRPHLPSSTCEDSGRLVSLPDLAHEANIGRHFAHSIDQVHTKKRCGDSLLAADLQRVIEQAGRIVVPEMEDAH